MPFAACRRERSLRQARAGRRSGAMPWRGTSMRREVRSGGQPCKRNRSPPVQRRTGCLSMRRSGEGIMATTAADQGWRSALPASVRPYTEAAPIAASVPRHLVGLSLRDDRRDADDAPQAGRDRQVDDHRLHARLPRLQFQIPLGVDRGRRAAAACSAGWGSACRGCW